MTTPRGFICPMLLFLLPLTAVAETPTPFKVWFVTQGTLTCFGWHPATGPVAHYEVEISEDHQVVSVAPVENEKLCLDLPVGKVVQVRARAVNETGGVGEWSRPLDPMLSVAALSEPIPVPEASGVAMLLAGLVGLWVLGRGK